MECREAYCNRFQQSFFYSIGLRTSVTMYIFLLAAKYYMTALQTKHHGGRVIVICHLRYDNFRDRFYFMLVSLIHPWIEFRIKGLTGEGDVYSVKLILWGMRSHIINCPHFTADIAFKLRLLNISPSNNIHTLSGSVCWLGWNSHMVHTPANAMRFIKRNVSSNQS